MTELYLVCPSFVAALIAALRKLHAADFCQSTEQLYHV